ncbi:hypothetical protein [Candidatus Mycobacterium methanotrophicum]|uniref:Type I restriction enzyme R protein N-terminal domain-containing protein n=1 Tax=Candidatus Mycobacterium methanotrophicum TaxID=2943498 RepID=A0ABY4QMK8_9MYCO|nr:hypothetical protein [Candidatus Mycobacterium methanotrophicum]UQX11747.1 hypothetical protein M5I08_04760 [Candidatus Mycobacterium methanotrophicum]
MADWVPGDAIGDDAVRHLASYQKCVGRIRAAWPDFAERRHERLQQGGLFGPPVEKIAENILEDLFTIVLDWPVANVKPQVDRADIVLTRLGLKWLVLEVKRPGSLLGHRGAIEAALRQARRYAADQRVKAVAVSDATMVYAADVIGGGLRHRAWLTLDTDQAPDDLWWLSVHGIYRPCPNLVVELGRLPERDAIPSWDGHVLAADDLHPKYKLAMQCFAYVGAANDAHSWKLPYLLANGITPDAKRLPKAIQCILSNYRGAQVDIPEADVGDVMVRLGIAAKMLGKMPCQNRSAANAYLEAHRLLEQLDRLSAVGCCGNE